MIKSTNFNREKLSEFINQPIGVKLMIMRSYEDLCLLMANDILEELTVKYCGRKYKNYGNNQYLRYGFNPGSIKVGNETMPVEVPRIKCKEDGSVFNLPEYIQMRNPSIPDEQLLQAVIKGISTRDYEGVLKDITQGFGLSKSSVSREFIEQSSIKLKEFQNRSLESHHFVALIVDGKYLANDQIIIALGITREGRKMPLAFIQAATENNIPIKDMFSDLVNRGFSYDDGLLVCLDGSKGMHKAVTEFFGTKAIIQRCQWHKRENVMSYLNEENKEIYKRKMQKAYSEEEYELAKEGLLNIHKELQVINQSAANSLLEGMEETLTLHRLQIPIELRRTFSTTNCIENLNSQLAKYIGRVKRWTNSNQKHRWVATGLIEIEGKMRKINSAKKLKEMQVILKNKTGIT